jgi:hypothetical protein
MVSIEVAIHSRLSLGNFSSLETTVPFYSENVAVDHGRRRMGAANSGTWVGTLVYGHRIPAICHRKSNE